MTEIVVVVSIASMIAGIGIWALFGMFAFIYLSLAGMAIDEFFGSPSDSPMEDLSFCGKWFVRIGTCLSRILIGICGPWVWGFLIDMWLENREDNLLKKPNQFFKTVMFKKKDPEEESEN